MRLFYFLILLVVSLPTAYAAQVAIIIDDIGYRQSDIAALSLPSNITLSVLPYTPLGKDIASKAHGEGYEIMLHLPMQALNGKKMGPGGLTNDMNEQEVKQKVSQALIDIPYAKGANNHMGSLLTQLNEPMYWVMESLKQHQAYFVDSVTTRYTKAGSAADSLGVPLLRRQLFLDNDTTHQGLEKQFKKLIEMAHQKGEVVAIAHPYPETIRFLKSNLPRLQAQGIKLVPTSRLLPISLAKKEGASPTARLK